MILRAIGLMVLSMALLAIGDATLKLATQHAPQGQVMTMLSVGGTILFVVIAVIRGVPLWSPLITHPLVLLRNGFEILAAIGMITALANIDLSVMAAVLQTTPLLVTIGAAFFLGESVGIRRWTAVFLGLIGMLIVIRPFGANFTGWELFAVLGASALAARDLVTRRAPTQVSTLALSTWGFMSTILPGLVMMMFSDRAVVLSSQAMVPMVIAILVTAFGYLAITAAMRMAPAAIVAPFRYSRLVFTAGLGVLIFAERPDMWTYLGAALILGAGLYSFLRERQLAQAATKVS